MAKGHFSFWYNLIPNRRPQRLFSSRQQKQQHTTKDVSSFFMIKGDRNLSGGGKIRNIRDAYEVNGNEEINKITK